MSKGTYRNHNGTEPSHITLTNPMLHTHYQHHNQHPTPPLTNFAFYAAPSQPTTPPTTAPKLGSSRRAPMVSIETQKETLTVSPGMVIGAASPIPAIDTMHAHYVGAHLMQPLPAPCDFTPIITPFMAAQWEAELHTANLYNAHIHVINGIRYGFDMGVHTIPRTSFTPPNHPSALNRPDIITAHIESERTHRRYTGPFSQSRLENLIGPF